MWYVSLFPKVHIESKVVHLYNLCMEIYLFVSFNWLLIIFNSLWQISTKYWLVVVRTDELWLNDIIFLYKIISLFIYIAIRIKCLDIFSDKRTMQMYKNYDGRLVSLIMKYCAYMFILSHFEITSAHLWNPCEACMFSYVFYIKFVRYKKS